MYLGTETQNLDSADKVVVFSDLHMGDGGRNDDFKANSNLFYFLIKEVYQEKGYTTVLNGDIEELYRFKYSKIHKAWEEIYQVFNQLNKCGKLHKIVGNHDTALHLENTPFQLKDAIKFKYNNNHIFIYHGHQVVNNIFERHKKLNAFIFKYLANPFSIGNYTVPLESDKKFKTETGAYLYSSKKKVLSIIGHTHRPLFESMSKRDTLIYTIDTLVRKFPQADQKEQKELEKEIKKNKKELDDLLSKDNSFTLRNSLYNKKLVVPSLFNSGTVMGKRGITAIEIQNGKIALVYWFDKRKSNRYLDYLNVDVENVPGTLFYKAVLKEENLDYIFSRIRLLS